MIRWLGEPSYFSLTLPPGEFVVFSDQTPVVPLVPAGMQSIHQIDPRLQTSSEVTYFESHKHVRSQVTGNADAHAYKRTSVFMHKGEQWFAILYIGHVLRSRFSLGCLETEAVRYSQNARLISSCAALHYLLGRRYATLTVSAFYLPDKTPFHADRTTHPCSEPD